MSRFKISSFNLASSLYLFVKSSAACASFFIATKFPCSDCSLSLRRISALSFDNSLNLLFRFAVSWAWMPIWAATFLKSSAISLPFSLLKTLKSFSADFLPDTVFKSNSESASEISFSFALTLLSLIFKSNHKSPKFPPAIS